MPDARTQQAIDLMTQFAERTGLTGARAPKRYLWTDAFAVCNYLGLAQATGEDRYAGLAIQLVHQVHHTLGRHREDSGRTGWISGLPEAEGEAHPARGGLRIGKPRAERSEQEPMDERLEWERDGQYFHYLTKWMHALDQVTRCTGQPVFNLWARELAMVAHRAFVYRPRGSAHPRMHWKMSVDLTRPLVGSMGQHDPLDGFVTGVQLEATAAGASAVAMLPDAIADFAAMIEPDALVTGDPLGLGGLLTDAYRVDQLRRTGAMSRDDDLFDDLLDATLIGLRHYAAQPDLGAPAERRLGFRELGLAIGLAAVGLMTERATTRVAPTGPLLDDLTRYGALRESIESFWLREEHRRSTTWVDHADINDVMLATSLVPDGFLVLRAPLRSA